MKDKTTILEIHRVIYVELTGRNDNEDNVNLLKEAFVAAKKMINKIRQYELGENNEWYEQNKGCGGELSDPPNLSKKHKIDIKKTKKIFKDLDNYPRYTICHIHRKLGKSLRKINTEDGMLDYVEEAYILGKKLSLILQNKYKARAFYGGYWPKRKDMK